MVFHASHWSASARKWLYVAAQARLVHKSTVRSLYEKDCRKNRHDFDFGNARQ
jgi:hypothetical protein